MKKPVLLIGIAAAAVVAIWLIDGLPLGTEEETPIAQRPGRAITAPSSIQDSAGAGSGSAIDGAGTARYFAEGPSTISLAEAQAAQSSQDSGEDVYVRGGRRIESRFTDQEVAAAQAAAAKQKKSAAVQNLDGSGKPVGQKPKLLSEFDSINAADCCTGTRFAAFVPPDPDLAVGPNHIIAVVNTAFEVYDKAGNSLTGPVQFATFFDPSQGTGGGTPGCTAFAFQFGAQRGAVFDPDVVYDAAADRFVLGIDGNGDSFCVAATQTGDPTGAWDRYGFPTNVSFAFFDFPHMGVGQNEIFVGSNQFGGTLPFGFEGRVFAIDKTGLYGGGPLAVATREVAPPGLEGPLNVKLDGTPQPAQTPTGPAHYIMTEFFDGKVHSVYSWQDPFGADIWTLEGDVDLAAASGVPCEGFSCFPIPWPQKGSVEILAANDYRGQETKVQGGTLWTTQTISCNPGKGVRDCIRWAQIDPTQVVPAPDQTAFPLAAGTNGVVQAGVFGSDWDYRTFPSIAANSCGDMAVGYSFSKAPGNSGGTWYPSIYVAGRKGSDPPGVIGGERLLKKALTDYSSFQDNGGNFPQRWGDYTGMQLDPDGKTFWYIGEYARAGTANPFTNWGNYIGSFQMPGCD